MLDEPTDSEEILKIKEQFRSLDENKDGKLDFRELLNLLRVGNPDMKVRDVRILFDSVDGNRDGQVDFDEFIDFIFSGDKKKARSSIASGRPTAKPKPAKKRLDETPAEEEDIDWAEIEPAFRAFAGRNGTMEGLEFHRLCRQCDLFDENFEASHVDVLFMEYARDDRKIGQKEFRAVLRRIAELKCVPATYIRGIVGEHGNGPALQNSTKAVAPRLSVAREGSSRSRADLGASPNQGRGGLVRSTTGGGRR